MRWYKRIALIAIALHLVNHFTASGVAAADLLVSAALSLKAPFEEIGRAYEEKNPGSKVLFNFAASGVLQKQIEAGAPSDLFASASPKEMDGLESAGLIVPGTRTTFAGNTLVLITASSRPASIKAFSDLGKQDLQKIAIGNPATVPAGKYAEEALKTFGLWDMLKGKMVYAEHVRQVMDYVVRNEVDAGIVFRTDAIARSGELRIVAEAPASSHKPVAYVIASLKEAKNGAAASNFIVLLRSDKGRDMLRKHGFTVNPAR